MNKKTTAERNRAQVEAEITSIHAEISAINTQYQQAKANIARNYQNPSQQDVLVTATHEYRLQGAQQRLDELLAEIDVFKMAELQDEYTEHSHRYDAASAGLIEVDRQLKELTEKRKQLVHAQSTAAQNKGRVYDVLTGHYGLAKDDVRALAKKPV